MKIKLTLLLISYFLTLNLFSENILSVGYNTGFSNFKYENTIITKGRENKDYIELSQNEYNQMPDTDFLVHFNNIDFTDEMGNYTISGHYNNISDVEKKFGSSSAFFLKNREISFTSNGDSLFSPGRILGNFSIEFWFKPTIINEDSILFSWKGVNKVESDFISQKIKCYFEDRRVVWLFENLFVPVDFSEYSIDLKSKTKLIPDQWNHILIRYNEELGILEFLLNGLPEDIKYTTQNNRESHTIYSPYIGNFSKSEILIGERFNGFIDEFRISEAYIEKPVLSKYSNSGEFLSPVYDIAQENVQLNSIECDDIIDKETDITYFYRFSDEPFLQENNYLKWLPIDNINEKVGRYIQIGGVLYSNGGSNKSPLIENVNIIWDEIPTPPAPQFVTSKALENALLIEWSPVKHYEIDGYLLYIGNESNNYTEMIDVGKNTSYTINKLKYKNIYYFSVRSYKGSRISDYSIEKFNRPE